MDEVHFLVIGIGLNVNSDKKSLPLHATSLKEIVGTSVRRVELLQLLLKHIEKMHELFEKKGSSAIVGLWRRYSSTLGKRVKVHMHQRHVEGEAVDIDTYGGLLIRRDSGVIEKIVTGDVTLCR